MHSTYVQGVPYPTGYFNQYISEQRQVPKTRLFTAVENQPTPVAPAHHQSSGGLTRVQLPAEALLQPPYSIYVGKPAFFDSIRGVLWDGHNAYIYKETAALKTAIETQPTPLAFHNGVPAPQLYPPGTPFYVEAPSVYMMKAYAS